MKKIILTLAVLATALMGYAQNYPPVETLPKVAPAQTPAFEGQTRIGGAQTQKPFKSTIVTSSLKFPWDLVFLPDGRMMVTEKAGTIRIVTQAGVVGAPIAGVPAVTYRSDSGLLAMVLDPEFATTRLVFWTFVEPLPDGNVTSVARARLSDNETTFENVTVIYRATPPYPGFQHPGARMLFDAQGKLYVCFGEHYDDNVRIQAQELNSSLGKIVKINKDGSPATGNPFADTVGARPEIWSLGHRDPQGLAFHPVTGQLWEAEHGPMAGDEVNIITPGGNYGWPTIAYGLEYTGPRKGLTVGNGTQQAGMIQPQYYWDPVVAPSGITFYTGSQMPEWKNNLFLATLRAKHIIRLVIDNTNKIVGEERLLVSENQRFRSVVQGPDGALYAITDQTVGRIYRIEAKSNNVALNTFKLNPSSSIIKGTTTASTANFSYSVPENTQKVNISAITPPGATMTINGTSTASGVFSADIPLTTFSTPITILVTAEDGITQKTYQVTVNKAGSANANLASLKLSTGVLNPAFAAGVTAYSAAVNNTTNAIQVTPTAAIADAIVKVNGITTTSGTASAPIPLYTGENAVAVQVTAPGGNVKTYLLTIDRAKSANVVLSTFKLKPSSSIVKGASANTYSYNVPAGTTKVNLSAVLPAGASMTINGSATASGVLSGDIPLNGNATQIIILVTAENGITQKTYEVTINRAMPMLMAASAATFNELSLLRESTSGTTPEATTLLVRQAVSPNGDGINDQLIIEGIASYPKNTLKIMNRNGDVVFNTTDYDNINRVFRGHTNNGKPVGAGTYYYALDYFDGKAMHTKTGYLVVKYDGPSGSK